MRILICDDEPYIADQLKNYVIEFFSKNKYHIPEIALFNNGHDFLKDTGQKDIVFLDIEMPEINGLYIGNYLSEKNTNTLIFIITSYMEYLDDAMRFHVFRYISKPVDKPRLFRNLKDAISEKYKRDKLNSAKIDINTGSSHVIVSLSDIIYVESMHHKTDIYTVSGLYHYTAPISYWLEKLPEEYFIQTHRCYIINMQYVSDYDHTFVYLCNKKYKVLITSRKYTAFKKTFLQFVGGTK